MWPFKKKKEQEYISTNPFDFELISNNRFLVNTDSAFNIPNWYVSGVIFKSDNRIILYIKDSVLDISNKRTSIIEILRNHKDVFNLCISYHDKLGCHYDEIFEDSKIVSVVRNPINYSDSSLSLICVEIKYESIGYKYYS